MAFAKSDGNFGYWDMGRVLNIIQTSRKTTFFAYWDIGAPIVVGEKYGSSNMMMAFWGI